MAFCTNCGNQLPEDAKACPNCGTPVTAQTTEQPKQQTPPQPVQAADHTAEFDPKDVADNKAMSILAYLGFLVLIPMLVSPAKDSPYVRFHVNQGLILLIGEVISSILTVVCIGAITGIICTILAIIGIVNVANGQAKDLPIIGKIRLLK